MMLDAYGYAALAMAIVVTFALWLAVENLAIAATGGAAVALLFFLGARPLVPTGLR